MYDIPKSLSSCTCLFYSTMQLPCRHLLYILVQQNKNIFIKEIIAERWTKEFNAFSDQAEEHENEKDLPDSVVDVMKYSEVSPCKMQKLSRHQKYRELMLLCKDFCDLSSDLPSRDYHMIYNFIKHTTQTIKDGKTVVVKELSQQMVSSEDEIYEEGDLPEDMIVNEDNITGELLRPGENKEQVMIANKDEVKDKKEKLQEVLVKQKLIVEDVEEVSKVMEEVQEGTSCEMDDEVESQHTSNSTEIIQDQEEPREAEHHRSKITSSVSSTFSYLKHLPNQNLEVLKNVHMQKKCKQRGRPAKKRAALSFASASTVKKKSKLNASANSSKPIVNSTIESQSFHGDVNNSNEYTCKSEFEPNHAEGKHKSFLHLSQNTLQVIRDDRGWLDDQIIKASMDILKNQYPMFRGFHNTLLGANLTFPVTELPFIQILHATELAYGNNPACYRYKQEMLRSHLEKSLCSNNLLPFPSTEVNALKPKKEYIKIYCSCRLLYDGSERIMAQCHRCAWGVVS